MFKPFITFIKLFSLRGEKFYFSIKALIGIAPKEMALYQVALTHKSAMVKDVHGRYLNNERLEYLGDALLGAIVAHELYLLYPTRSEGFLTKIRSRIVNRTLLNQIASRMGLASLVKSQSKIDVTQTHILGDALEALIGAIYMDQGFKATQTFILNKLIAPYIDLEKLEKKDSNYKSLLIEWAQKNKQNVHFVTEEHHSAKRPTPEFISSAFIDDMPFGEGKGYSKKEAQQNAAQQALKKVRNLL